MFLACQTHVSSFPENPADTSSMDYRAELDAAIARRLSNLSRTLERTIRALGQKLPPDLVAELWQAAATLYEAAEQVRPSTPPETPAGF